MNTRIAITSTSFESGGVQCAADLYLPANLTGKLPCVVMGNGFSGTKDFIIPAYAEQFALNGFAVFAFDYRGFGISAGMPRQVVDVKRHRQDWLAAIHQARNLEMIDAQRIAVWGTSMAGGHVIEVAAQDSQIAAVIAQVPMLDALRGHGTETAPAWVQIKFLWAAVSDVIRGWLGFAPYLAPVVGKPGSFAAMTEPDATLVVEQLIADGSTWRNEFAPRVAFGMPRYQDGTIEQINAPILACIADGDVQAAPEFAARVFSRAPQGHIIYYPVGHFGLYVGEMRDKAITDQVKFLERHLLPGAQISDSTKP